MPDQKKRNDLIEFMEKASHEMESEYERIQKRASEDPGTAGDQGEENWATLFRGWLPHAYHIVTKGRILSRDGIASRQVDVLILDQNYPQNLIDKKLYLAGGVVAAFECKVTLKAKHIEEAFRNSVEIRSHIESRTGTPYKEFHSPILFGLLAHSHNWKNKNSKPILNMEKNIKDMDTKYILHPCQMPDLICVADLATWAATKGIVPSNHKPNSKIIGITAYIDDLRENKAPKDTTPIGALITQLLRKLAWENTSLRGLADYFLHAGVAGLGKGDTREWGLEIFSAETRNKILMGGLTNKTWDEWCIAFW